MSALFPPDWLENRMEVCPGCGGVVSGASCHMWYSTWRCFGCGAEIDGRVARPRSVRRCMVEQPTGYPYSLIDSCHVASCVCEGKGWTEWPDELAAARTGDGEAQ